MNDEEIILARGRELKEHCADNSIITTTNFLDLNEQNLISRIEKENNRYVDTYYFGGYSLSERVVAVFVPKFIEIDEKGIQEYFYNNVDECPISVLKVKKDKYASLSHRDYLGSIMALGIKRNMVGDIIVEQDGCTLFCMKSITKFLLENLSKSGRGTLKCSVSDFSKLPDLSENVTEIFAVVSSLRLDNIVSNAFKISRNSAVEAIEKGLVFVNSKEIKKADVKITTGDKIVLRGNGKAVFKEIVGLSKKEKIRIKIIRYN